MVRRILTSLLIIVSVTASIAVSTQAAFTATATVSGINFSTGNASLQLFGNLGYTNAGNNGNLTHTLPGTGFSDIRPNWSKQYLLKYFNAGSMDLDTSIRAIIKEDTSNLASHIQVQTWIWQDSNGNGAYDGTDVLTPVGTQQTITSLANTPIPLGVLARHNARGLRMLFTTQDLPDETQQKKLVVDFVLNGTTANITP